MTSPKEFILHIGDYKTGSTALQQFFARNSDQLLTNGVCYPELIERHRLVEKARKGEKTSGNAGLLARCLLKDDAPARTAAIKFEEELLEEVCRLARSGQPRILLSSEHFRAATLSSLRKFRKRINNSTDSPVRFTVVLYLRRQDERIISGYIESVKNGKTSARIENFAEFRLERNLLDANYLEVIEKFETVFGRPALKVRCYEKGQFHGGGLLQDFLHVIGVEDKGTFHYPKSRSYPSMSMQEVQFARHLNRLGLPDKERKVLLQIFKETVDQPTPMVFPPGWADKILKAAELGNQKIAKDYLQRDDGVLFCRKLTQPGNTENYYQDLTADQFSETLARMVLRCHGSRSVTTANDVR